MGAWIGRRCANGARPIVGGDRAALCDGARPVVGGDRAALCDGARPVAAIELQGVVKAFGPIRAVDGLDLSVPEGVCLGLLGPNGAGKSTTMRLLTGQAIADDGSLRVLGYELPKESKEARARMGVVPQLDNLDIDVTVEENLRVFARLYRVRDLDGAVDRALALARLTDRRHDSVDELSRAQVERLADEVALMASGRVIVRGRPGELIAEHAGRRTAEYYAPPERRAEVRASAEAAGLPVRSAGPALVIVGCERAPDGIVPEDAITRPSSLEDVFIELTGEELE